MLLIEQQVIETISNNLHWHPAWRLKFQCTRSPMYCAYIVNQFMIIILQLIMTGDDWDQRRIWECLAHRGTEAAKKGKEGMQPHTPENVVLRAVYYVLSVLWCLDRPTVWFAADLITNWWLFCVWKMTSKWMYYHSTLIGALVSLLWYYWYWCINGSRCLLFRP